MGRVVVLGGTGYAGSAIVSELARRGHAVTALSRRAPELSISGVEYVSGSADDSELLARLIASADIVIGALTPFKDLSGRYIPIYRSALGLAAKVDARFIVIGGFSSLRPSVGAPNFIESGDVPHEYLAGAKETAESLKLLQEEAPDNLDWLFVSPAANFGAHNPGRKTGKYQLGGDVALYDASGESNLSSPDLATAIVDEIESPTHHRQHISVIGTA